MSYSPAAQPPAMASDAPVKVNSSYVWLMVLAQFGVYMAFVTPMALSLSIRLEQLAPDHAHYLGYVGGSGGIVAIIANPVIGRLSDRTRSRLGRRRPYLIVCTVIGALALPVMAGAPNVVVLGLGWAVAQLGWGVILTLLTASLADRLPASQRGRVSGMVGVVWQLAPVAGAVVAGSLASDNMLLFLVPGAVGVLTMTVFVCFVREPDSRTTAPAEPFSLRSVLGTVVFDPRKAPEFAWSWLGRFLIMFGLTLNTTFTAFFLADRTGQEVKNVAGLVAVLGVASLLLTMLGAFGGGFLSDRLGRRRIFLFGGAVVFAVGSVATAFAPSVPSIIVCSVFGGLGIGMFSSVEQALILDLLPERQTEAGRFTGIALFSTTIAQGIAPFLAPAILLVGADHDGKNYTLLYLFAAGMAVIGGLVILTRIKSVR